MPSETRPNLFIVGAQKSGTSSIAAWLDDHHEVFMSRPKEPGYLAFGEQRTAPAPQGVITALKEYLGLFASATGAHKIVGEASTWYFAIPGVAETIKQFSPTAKIVIILRDPVDRAYSAWSHARRDNIESHHDFQQAWAADKSATAEREYILRYREMGSYSAQLGAYQHVFPADQLLVLFFDDLVRQPDILRKTLYQFLNISLDHSPSLHRRYNRSGIPRSRALRFLLRSDHFRLFWRRILPIKLARGIKVKLDDLNMRKLNTIKPEMRRELQDYYHDDIEKLMAMTGRDLSDWLRC